MNTTDNESIQTTSQPTQPRSEREDRPVVIQRPLVTSHEDELGVRLQLALPGVRKEDLRISLHESNLQITAPRRDEVPDGYKTLRNGGGPIRFELNARLTNRLDGSKIEAALEDGVLTLRIPLREEAKPREIRIS
jgi:HSP20 family protein